MAEAEASVKKSKKVKALVDNAAEEPETKVPKKDKKIKIQKPNTEDVELEAPKKEKKRKKQEQLEAAAEATPEGVDADEEKRKRKEEKKKRKQAAAEAAAAAEEDADFAQAEAEAEADATAAEEDATKKRRKAEQAGDAGAPKVKAVPPPFFHIDDLTVFIGGLPFSCTLDALRKEFSKCGEIQCVKLPGNLKGNRGIAFITYASEKGAQKAIKLDGEDYGGRTLRVNLAGEKRPEKVKDAKEGKDGKTKGNSKGDRAFQVFVGGLPFQATEAILRKDFGECGEIRDFNLPMNEDGKPKGFMFVTYATQDAVEKALAFHDTAYGGRTLTVNRVAGKGKGKESNDKGKGRGKGQSQTFEGDDGDE